MDDERLTKKNHISVTPEAGKEFYQTFNDNGKVVMLNLLKFRTKADYTNLDHLRPQDEISGEEAYKLYMKHTWPEIKNAGARVLYFGKSKSFLIGPESEKWDVILIVEHESVQKFIDFAQNENYLKTAGHRNAALEDSRLLPSNEIKLFG